MKKEALIICLVFSFVSALSTTQTYPAALPFASREALLNGPYDPYLAHGAPFSLIPSYFRNTGNLEAGELDETFYLQSRLSGLGINAFNNIFLNNRVLSLDSCTGDSGESGVCATSTVCTILSASASGSCSLGRVCCINKAVGCGKTVTVNNTYWQAPSSISTPSTCSLTVKLDSKLAEQGKSVCQVRLDFSEFTTAQPSAIGGTSRGVCDTDTFEITGASNTVPVICGDNGGQHMYLTIPNSGTQATNLQLKFKFNDNAAVSRSWKIKTSFLVCNSDYLAPDGCLQYFTTSSGTVSSFNFKDTTPASRKLANQDYGICFRAEVVSGQTANQLCLDECSVSDGNDAFRISADGDVSQLVDLLGFCQRDFLVFIGGTNGDGLSLDRFCGGALNTASINDKGTVCSKMTPFKINFKTDGTEVVSVTADPANNIEEVIGDNLNVGFCLKFSQKVVSS